MITFTDLQEGVYDPNIFKAFFIAGGPGSGKSFVVRKTTGGLGMKVVNSDDIFEKLLDKEGLSKKMLELVSRTSGVEEIWAAWCTKKGPN